MAGEAMAEAVELATVALAGEALGPRTLEQLAYERLRSHPMRALIGQASLSGALCRIAAVRLDSLLGDPEALRVALERAEQGRPVSAEELGLDAPGLLRAAGIAAAKL